MPAWDFPFCCRNKTFSAGKVCTVKRQCYGKLWMEAIIVAFLDVYVVVNFLSQLIFIFPLFWGMVMYANEF